MKTPSDEIYQLIQAMSAAEKRYFKIHFSSEKNLVTDLFNYLNTMKKYDEKEVKNHFKKSKLSKNLKVYKIMLTELLLKSLSSFRYKKDVSSTIRQNMEEVEILVEKNLLPLAYKKLQKTKKLCLEYEDYDRLVSVLDWEYQFEVFFDFKKTSNGNELLQKIIDAAKTTTDIIEAKKDTYNLSLAATSIYNSPPHAMSLKDYETKHLNTLLKIKETSISQNFKKFFYAHSALGHLYHSTKDNGKEYFHKKTLVDFFTENKKFVHSCPKKYWAANFNFANCCLRTDRKEEFENALSTLKTIETANPIFHSKLEKIQSMELAFHRQCKNYDYIINELEPIILENAVQQNNNKKKVLTFSFTSLMLTHLSLGNHSKVQFYLRRLFKFKPIEKEFILFFEIIDLINHYEANDKYALQILLESKKRKIKREPNYGTIFYNRFLDFFNQLTKQNHNLSELIDQLKIDASKNSDDRCLNFFRYFIFDEWLSAIENNRPFAEQLER